MSEPAERRRPVGPPSRLFLCWAAVVLLVGGLGIATRSVAEYRLWMVESYTGLLLVLAGALLFGRGSSRTTSVTAFAAGLALAAGLTVDVHAFSYLQFEQATEVRTALASTAALAAALVLLAARPAMARLADIALLVAIVGFAAVAAALIRLDPTPHIDVWVTLQQASDAIAKGRNIYTQHWVGSPGIQDAFTYLPFTALLLAPGRWLFGDVRWALAGMTVIGALAVRALALGGPPRQRAAAAGAAALLLLVPGTPTQMEQAWTEPLLLACLAGWACGVRFNRSWLSVLCLALGLASKQHLLLVLPVVAVWPRFGLRRALASAVLAGLFVLPWLIASPKDLLHDTVTVLVGFHAILFADTLYIAAIRELHWMPPFWITGAVTLAALLTAMILVRRRRPPLGTVLRWCALVLFAANLVNKQAFYNQYWLVAALVITSWAADAGITEPVPDAELSSQRAAPVAGSAAATKPPTPDGVLNPSVPDPAPAADPAVSEPTPVSDSPPRSDPTPISNSTSVSDRRPELDTKPVPDPTPELDAKPVPGPTPELDAKPGPEPTPELDTRPLPGPTPVLDAKPVPEPTPEFNAKPAPDPEPEPPVTSAESRGLARAAQERPATVDEASG